jgi:hypothetical protein
MENVQNQITGQAPEIVSADLLSSEKDNSNETVNEPGETELTAIAVKDRIESTINNAMSNAFAMALADDSLNVKTSITENAATDEVSSVQDSDNSIVTKSSYFDASKADKVTHVNIENPNDQKNVEQYPDPEGVLENVEKRNFKPKSNHLAPKKRSILNQLSDSADRIKNETKARAALFSLPHNRPASQFIREVFDSSSIDGVDGVHHINAHRQGKTELGVLLDMDAHTPFDHPEAGSFESAGGFWHYVRTRPLLEDYRELYGNKLLSKVSVVRDISRIKPGTYQQINVKGFRTIIADALWHKVTQNSNILELMTNSTLPFEQYYLMGELSIRKYPKEGYWISAAFEEIRRATRERLSTGDTNIQPNFSKIETMTDPRAYLQDPYVNGPRKQSPYGKRTSDNRS